jgi:hypothetical protein
MLIGSWWRGSAITPAPRSGCDAPLREHDDDLRPECGANSSNSSAAPSKSAIRNIRPLSKGQTRFCRLSPVIPKKAGGLASPIIGRISSRKHCSRGEHQLQSQEVALRKEVSHMMPSDQHHGLEVYRADFVQALKASPAVSASTARMFASGSRMAASRSRREIPSPTRQQEAPGRIRYSSELPGFERWRRAW